MFIITKIEDKMKITPDRFDCDFHEVLRMEIEAKYLNRVIPDVGLCITFYDFVKVGDPYVYPSEGSVHAQVVFRLVVFRPFPSEVIIGKVVSCSSEGLLVSLGFFDNIVIPNNLLQSPSIYNSEHNHWTWKYNGLDEEDGEEGDASFVIKTGDTVRFTVRVIAFTKTAMDNKGVTSYITSSTSTHTTSASASANNSVMCLSDESAPSTGLRKRSTSIDQILHSDSQDATTTTSSNNSGKLDATMDELSSSSSTTNNATKHMKNTSIGSSHNNDSITPPNGGSSLPPPPSSHQPMRVIGCMDGDGLGLLTWWL